jgi:ribosomal subunit interface protein
MNIQVDGTNLEISQKIKEIIDQKLSLKLDQLLPDFNNEIKTAFLHLEKDKYQNYIAKFDMALPGQDGHIVATHQHRILVSAIIGVREAVEKQIKKYKQDKTNYSLG